MIVLDLFRGNTRPGDCSGLFQGHTRPADCSDYFKGIHQVIVQDYFNGILDHFKGIIDRVIGRIIRRAY